MPTPVGPVPRDPDDPDLWDEWYEDDDGVGGTRFGWPLRAIALLIVVGIVLVYVLAGWWRGRYGFWRADVLAATLFAALDVVVPLALVALLWWIVRSLSGRLIPFL